MAMRMDDIEETTTHHGTAIQQLQVSSQPQNFQLRDFHRHLEDLDNHCRHHNLWVRGLPETVEHSQLAQATISIFNDDLGRPPESAIEYEHLHRALKPKIRDTDPPRNVVCCLVNFKLKEKILVPSP